MSARDLTILTVTKGEPFAQPFISEFADIAAALGAHLVVCVDSAEPSEYQRLWPWVNSRRGAASVLLGGCQSKGFIESVLDHAVEMCESEYIFRLDDDERMSDSLVEWLSRGDYRERSHWKFPRAHCWGDRDTFIAAAPLWPDVQTRLSLKNKSGGRHTIHAGSPYGGGTDCPWHIEHHKFLVKDYAERARIAEVYDRFHPGYGTGQSMLPFSLPERAFPDLPSLLRPLREAGQQ